ncbi:hypothetical protein JD844_017774 [Phrynosoma platyrhinos]|uniref:Uncharacterized protein n=1 Tax=Phrynosoma platyrhinos TaxID=52577 RepID=A0ABQ7SMH7_PHRPL|nr:hypothetical protein JD844_017774 [Phrynosoma platyrhinos]
MPFLFKNSLMPLKEVLRHKCYIRDGTKGMHIRQTPAVHSSKSTLFHTIELEQLAAIKKRTSQIQTVDLKNCKELHLYLRRLKYPLLSTILRLEEKKKIKQKKSRPPPRKGLLDGRQTEMKDDMATEFRLSVCRMPFYSLIKETQHYQDKENDFFDAVHDMRYFTHPEPETMSVHEPGSIDKRVFARAFGTIRLRPLCAIDKGYWQSHNLDIQLEKERKVLQRLIARNEGQEYVNHLHEERRENAQKKYEEDKMMTDDILKENKQKREMLINKMKHKYDEFLENKERKTIENTFVQRFSNQHTALTKGLIRLDGWRKREETVHERKHIVRGIAEEERQRKEMQQMLQRLNTDEKCFRQCLAHAMASDRFKRSKGKIEAMKKPRLKIPYSLPVIGSSGLAVPILQYEGLDGNV